MYSVHVSNTCTRVVLNKSNDICLVQHVSTIRQSMEFENFPITDT